MNVFVILWATACSAAALPADEKPLARAAGLRVQSETAPDILAAKAGRPARLVLSTPGTQGWADVNVGSFMVRGPSRQESLASAAGALRGHDLEYTFAEPGLYLIALSTGPPDAKNQSDSWQRVTRCSKLCLRVTDERGSVSAAANRVVDPGLTAKVGQRFEIVPLFSPVALKVGADLPVRVFFDFEKLVAHTVQAIRPDGSTDVQTTNPVGIVNFRITQTGRWIIQYEKPLEGVSRIAELVFEVPATQSQEPKP